MQKTNTETKAVLFQIRLWNLSTLAEIYRERGDEKAAAETERERWELLKSLKAGLQ